MSESTSKLENVVRNLSKRISEDEIAQKLLEPLLVNGQIIDSIHKNPSDLFSLTTRTTVNELTNDFLVRVKSAQEIYKKSIENCLLNLKLNLEKCIEMDEILGCNESSIELPDNVEIISLKDGTRKIRCPMHNCATSTYKIKRHLSEVHGDLSDVQQQFALKIAHAMERNKSRNSLDTEQASTEKKKKKIFNPIGLVSRRGNYKECLLCSQLYVNLSDHVFKSHKIPRSDPAFHHYVTTPAVVPDCYTKMEAGKKVKLTGEELENAKEQFEETISTQERSLQEMKRLKLSIINLRKQITASEDGREDLLGELAEVQKTYFSYRYPDTRIYSSNVDIWRTSFLLHLENKNTPNPKRIQRMAFDVFLPYEQSYEKLFASMI